MIGHNLIAEQIFEELNEEDIFITIEATIRVFDRASSAENIVDICFLIYYLCLLLLLLLS